MRGLTILVVSAVLVGGIPTSAHAVESTPGPTARAAWSMVPQSKDANGDGVIDGDGGVPKSGATSRIPSSTYVGQGNHVAQPHERLIGGSLSWYLSPRGFPVRLDACASTGDQARWIIRQGNQDVRRTPWRSLTKGCRQTVFLPEGTYSTRLEVRRGGQRDARSIDMDVRNILMVALGDSYASGEGNPRNVRAWLRQGGSLVPYWDDDPCNRSARGAPALAALALERASRYTSVTLVDVACSGATVARGILGPQTQAAQALSQVEQAARIVGSRSVDLVTLSIGGNDVGFTSILQTCAFNGDCPLAAPGPGPLAGYPTVQQGVQARTGELSGALERVADCFSGGECTLADGRRIAGLTLSERGRILPTLYPDITRGPDGQPCSYLTIPEQDFAWARATILDPAPPPAYSYPLLGGGAANLSVAQGSLNQQLAASQRFTAWLPVTSTWSRWASTPAGHGVCAGETAWVFGFTGLSGFPSASFHPNPAGQQVLGRAISDAAQSALS